MFKRFIDEKGSSPDIANPISSLTYNLIRGYKMTIGIYSLYWEEADLIYIGQSVNIERRFREHLTNLVKNKHCNIKLQEAYNVHGRPINIILEIISENLLDNREIYWIKEFNSYENGLNSSIGGKSGGYGINAPYSKYTEFDRRYVLKLLTRKNLSYTKIAKLANVNISLVKGIAHRASHTDLENKYPNTYKRMLLVKANRHNKISDRFDISLLDKNGNVHTNVDLKNICNTYSLDYSAMVKVINGKAKTHKGWRCLS
jgi:group I intron endonuclease